MSVKEIWSKVKEHFFKMSDLQKQGESLKTRKKIFMMLNKGIYVVKLPKERVDDLISTDEGKPYDPGNGRIIKEWVIIPIKNSDKWIDLAAEGKDFSKTLAK